MLTLAFGRDFINREMANINKPFIWISIREPDISEKFYKNFVPPSMCKDTLVLHFSDLIHEDYSEELISRLPSELKGFVPFDLIMKNKIDDFIEKNKDINLCIVNCHMGVSRSPAISAYIEKKTGESDWYKKYYSGFRMLPCFYICRILELPIPNLN